MVSAPRFPRLFAGALAALGLLGTLACGGKKDHGAAAQPSVSISGTVDFTRIPLRKDGAGVPLGLETDPTKFETKLPGRFLIVKLFRRRTTTLPDGSTQVYWTIAGQSHTDETGAYRFDSLTPGNDFCVQLESAVLLGDSGVNVLADPDGLASTLPEAARLRYVARVAPDGTPAAPGLETPYTTVNADAASANFHLDVATPWLLGRTDLSAQTPEAPLFPQAVFETSPTGSRVLNLLDRAYEVYLRAGGPFSNATLDLHYRAGLSDPKGTFIEFDRTRWIQPDGTDLAFDADSDRQHWFGSVRGAAANDDAWDAGVLLPMLARAAYLQRVRSGLFGGGGSQELGPVPGPADNLVPDLALTEGLPDALAANILKSPYLADTAGASLASIRDIRDLSLVPAADQGALSPRTLAAASWALILKGNSLPDPGTSADWDKINPDVMARYFGLTLPSGTIDLYNFYNQALVLQGAKAAQDPVDLSAIFTDAALTPLLQPYNITWPRPTTGHLSGFVTSLGNDPGKDAPASFGPYTLSMAKAVQIGGSYPDLTDPEMQYLDFTLDMDMTYALSVTTSPATLPSGAQLEVCFLTAAPARQTFLLSGSTAQPIPLTLTGTTGSIPQHQAVRLRIFSPSTQIPDVQVSLAFAKALVPARPR